MTMPFTKITRVKLVVVVFTSAVYGSYKSLETCSSRVAFQIGNVAQVYGTAADLMRAGAGRDIRFGAPPGLDVAGLTHELDAVVAEARPGEYVVEAEATPARVAASDGATVRLWPYQASTTCTAAKTRAMKPSHGCSRKTTAR